VIKQLMDMLIRENIYVGAAKNQRYQSAAETSRNGRTKLVLGALTIVCAASILGMAVLAVPRREYSGFVLLVFGVLVWLVATKWIRLLTGRSRRRADEDRMLDERLVATRDWLRLNTDDSQLKLLMAEPPPNHVVWLTDDGLYWSDAGLTRWSRFEGFAIKETQHAFFVVIFHKRISVLRFLSGPGLGLLFPDVAIILVCCLQTYAIMHVLLSGGQRYDMLALCCGVIWSLSMSMGCWWLVLGELKAKSAVKLSILTRLDGGATEKEAVADFLEGRLRPIKEVKYG